jgi:putative Mn2+ efflux pump MntP
MIPLLIVFFGKYCTITIGNPVDDFNGLKGELFLQIGVVFLSPFEILNIKHNSCLLRIDMDFLSVFLIAVGLGMDAFAVAIGTGVTIRKLSFGPVFRLSFHFGFFQFLMPVVGWLAGRTISGYIAGYDHWIAFGLLLLVGSKMISDSFKDPEVKRGDPSRGLTLVVLSVATSIDALAVGLGLAFLNTGILCPSIIIGIVAFVMTIVGMVFARVLGRLLGRNVEIFGGLLLIGIGIKVLIEHL